MFGNMYIFEAWEIEQFLFHTNIPHFVCSAVLNIDRYEIPRVKWQILSPYLCICKLVRLKAVWAAEAVNQLVLGNTSCLK